MDVPSSQLYLLGFALRFRPRACEGNNFGKRFFGVGSCCEVSRVIRAVFHHKLIDNIFDQLALFSDNADEGNIISNACLDEFFQGGRIWRWSMQNDFRGVWHSSLA